MNNKHQSQNFIWTSDYKIQHIIHCTVHTLSISLRKQSSPSLKHSHIRTYGNTDTTVKHIRKLKKTTNFLLFFL